MSKPWPKVDDVDPQLAAWRQAVEERMDSGFSSALDELAEIKVQIVELKTLVETRKSLSDVVVHALDAPNTKYVLAFLALIVMVMFAGSGIYLSWGDLHVGKDRAFQMEADADVDL